MESPLLETSVDGAQSILLSITGGTDLSLFEVNDAAKAVAEAAHPDANIIFGAMVDEKLGDEVWITVVATGYGDKPRRAASASVPARPPTPTTSRASPPTPPRERVGRGWTTWTCRSSFPRVVSTYRRRERGWVGADVRSAEPVSGETRRC